MGWVLLLSINTCGLQALPFLCKPHSPLSAWRKHVGVYSFPRQAWQCPGSSISPEGTSANLQRLGSWSSILPLLQPGPSFQPGPWLQPSLHSSQALQKAGQSRGIAASPPSYNILSLGWRAVILHFVQHLLLSPSCCQRMSAGPAHLCVTTVPAHMGTSAKGCIGNDIVQCYLDN